MHSSKRWTRRALVAGGSAAALVLASASVAGSSPAGDDEGEPVPVLTASLSGDVLVPGGQLNYSSIDPCPINPHTRVLVLYAPAGWSTDDEQERYHGFVDVESDGSWSTTLPIGDEVPEGQGGWYEVGAQCLSSDHEQEPGQYDPSDVITAEYELVGFEVVLDTPDTTAPTPTTEAPRTRPEPARPVPGRPDYAG